VLDTRSHLLRYGRTAWLILLLAGSLLIWPTLSTADEEALALIRKREDILRSRTNFGRYRMQLIRPTWERAIAFVTWDDVANRRSFTRILAPPKDKDTTFLKVGYNLWTYLPKLERDLKLPPSMMLNAWMGSDFTNDDTVKVTSTIEDYTHRTIARQGEGPDEIVTIESLPKPDAPVVWGKLIHRLTGEAMPLETEFYDEHDRLVRRLVFENVQEFKGHSLPTRWTMLPSTEPGQRTVMHIEHIEFDLAISPTVFERAHLSRRGQ
jgi:hypothetical protein